MEEWQRGYELEFLREVVGCFDEHNARALSLYSRINEAAAADALAAGTLYLHPWGQLRRTVAKVSRPVYAYHDTCIGHKLPGDHVVDWLAYNDPAAATRWLTANEDPTWVWVWQEDPEMVSVVEAAGYQFMGAKVTAAAELRGLYFHEGAECLLPEFQRPRVALAPEEELGVCRTGLKLDAGPAAREVWALPTAYADHYSKYNSGKSWAALALRGYTSDPAFIIKPAEMSKKWRAEHAGVDYGLQDTPLRAQLPACEELARPLTSIAEVHRMRLMRLGPGGGELRRHSDLTDPDSGIADGRVARFHIPLITNYGVVFGSWDMRGRRHEVHMRAGECWYLDTRKPHTAVNSGAAERVHLVLDVVSNAEVRELLAQC